MGRNKPLGSTRSYRCPLKALPGKVLCAFHQAQYDRMQERWEKWKRRVGLESMPQTVKNGGRTMGPRFKLGSVVVTRGVAAEIQRSQLFRTVVRSSLDRHVAGDWGDLSAEDKEQNEWSLKHGERLLSAYQYPSAPKIWIITERDRSATTVLFPDEY